MKAKEFDIEQHEQEILKDFEKGKLVPVEDAEEEMRLAKEAARNFMKRDNRVNVRISGADLNMVRRIAVQEGLPYQTLLASIIHKYVTGRLVDRNSGQSA